MRKGSLWTVLLAASSSLGLMLLNGRRQPSAVLLLIFTIWVMSPFVGLGWVNRRASGHSASRQLAAYWLICIVSAAAVAAYASVTFVVHLGRPAGPFLIVPLVSWLVIGVWSALESRRLGI